MMTKEEKIFIKNVIEEQIDKFWNMLSGAIAEWVRDWLYDFFESSECMEYGNTEKAMKLFVKRREKEKK